MGRINKVQAYEQLKETAYKYAIANEADLTADQLDQRIEDYIDSLYPTLDVTLLRTDFEDDVLRFISEIPLISVTTTAPPSAATSAEDPTPFDASADPSAVAESAAESAAESSDSDSAFASASASASASDTEGSDSDTDTKAKLVKLYNKINSLDKDKQLEEVNTFIKGVNPDLSVDSLPEKLKLIGDKKKFWLSSTVYSQIEPYISEKQSDGVTKKPTKAELKTIRKEVKDRIKAINSGAT